MLKTSMRRPLLPQSTCRHCEQHIVLAPVVDWVHLHPSGASIHADPGTVDGFITMCADKNTSAAPDPGADIIDVRLRLTKPFDLEDLVDAATPLPLPEDSFDQHRPGMIPALLLGLAISLVVWVPVIILITRLL